jgi:recombination protein RecT
MATSDSANQKETLRGKIESKEFKLAIASVLPSHLTPDRFVRLAIAASTRTPRLGECDPNTVLQCLMSLSQFGLEPDGRNAHLVPFKNQRGSYDCTLIIDYKGLATLAKRSGQVSYVHADMVCENDQFEFNKGVVVKHEVDFKKDRGKPYAYYAMVRYKDGTEQAAAMTKAEVDRIKARSRAGNSGPWVTDYDEMGKKTVFRRLSKWLELSPEFRDALEADSDTLEELHFENAIPIQRPKVRLLKNQKAHSGSGSETTSAEGDAANTGDVTPATDEPNGSQSAAPSNEPAPEKPKGKKKLQGLKSEPEGGVQVGPNEQKMMMRLEALKLSKDDLVTVARQLDAVDPSEGWDAIGEDRFDVLLREANWSIVEEALKNLAK